MITVKKFVDNDGDAATIWDSGEEMDGDMVHYLECLFSGLEERMKREDHIGKQFTSQVSQSFWLHCF